MNAWEPHTEVSEEYVDPVAVAGLGALFDVPVTGLDRGDPLPPLWHWVALPRWPASSSIGPDGHPVRGGFLPPVTLPRRMFAGGDVEWAAPITIGSTVRREARVLSVTQKTGRSGQLVIVVVEIRLSEPASGATLLVERQNLVYREDAAAGQARAVPSSTLAGPPLRPGRDQEWEFRTDPTLLLRFSALTANAHRIHYDWPYATTVEGYSGLVVHGPLTTLALAETLRRTVPVAPIRLRHRNLAPLFCAAPAQARRLRRSDPEITVGMVGSGSAPEPTVHAELTAEFPTPGEPHA